jgi:hypothetical protein
MLHDDALGGVATVGLALAGSSSRADLVARFGRLTSVLPPGFRLE